MAEYYDIYPHMQGSLPCVIDVETTDKEPLTRTPIIDEKTGDFRSWEYSGGEIIQIAILPLDMNFEPLGRMRPFYTNVRPQYPHLATEEAMRVHKVSLSELEQMAPPVEKVIEMLQTWFESLDLPVDRRIIPVAHNWTFEKSFLTTMLGMAEFERIFHFHARDTMQMALYLKDKAAFTCRSQPFGQVGLRSLCEHFSITLDNHHDALADCLAQAALYRHLLKLELAL